MNSAKRAILVILDGWGHGHKPEVDAIFQAHTPFTDSLYEKYPHSELITHGEQVGLPEGQMGNSEVGHLNIGAGRIVYQELARINKAIETRHLHQNEALLKALNYAKTEEKSVHLMGLVSDGGVHSHIQHLKALCDITQEQGLANVYIHAFTDGRDTAPKGGLAYLKDLLEYIETQTVQLASVVGRYYAMDRDKRWERIKKAYDLLVKGVGETTALPLETIKARYDAEQTDEFLEPIVCTDAHDQAIAKIQADDVVICFNFRTDRPREITEVLSQKDMPEYEMQKLPLHYVSMTRYDETFENIAVLFTKDDLPNTLGEVLCKAGKTQTRIAETEKYPHVTFFFSGGREAAFKGENRLVIPSPKVATYDLQPEMSAFEITSAIIKDIKVETPDFICLNYANADMVGHTGDFEAAKTAANTVDRCLENLVEVGLKHDYQFIIIADHGNSDFMVNADGSPHTAHTTNPVPCFYVAKDSRGRSLKDGKLADIAPTILALMGLNAPDEMDGTVLI
ncbi:MAG: 2,3-bisphosphoglycerate-independent phosphoglycerate mutase [Bacteroidota bacterium]